MKWIDVSEIVCGLVMKDKINPHAINPLNVYPQYVPIIAMKRDGADMTAIVATISFSDVDACLQAADRVDGTIRPEGYIKILEQVSVKASAAMDLARAQKRLENGEDVDIASILQIANKLENGHHDLTPLSDIEPQKVKFMKTGYAPLDKHVGGIPPSCVTIIGGTPGIGKTTLALKILSDMACLPENKKKYGAIFSLEMTMGQIHQRYIEIGGLKKEDKERILVGESAYTIQEIYAIATKTAANHKMFAILIDFADLIVEGEQSEAVMGVIYRNLAMLAKKTGIPIILVCQLSRNAYDGGLPKIHHLRYSGLAEATARLILMVYNPNVVMAAMNKDKIPLKVVPDRAYILVGKSNFGFKEGAPGAIMVDFDGGTGWGSKSYDYFPVNV